MNDLGSQATIATVRHTILCFYLSATADIRYVPCIAHFTSSVCSTRVCPLCVVSMRRLHIRRPAITQRQLPSSTASLHWLMPNRSSAPKSTNMVQQASSQSGLCSTRMPNRKDPSSWRLKKQASAPCTWPQPPQRILFTCTTTKIIFNVSFLVAPTCEYFHKPRI